MEQWHQHGQLLAPEQKIQHSEKSPHQYNLRMVSFALKVKVSSRYGT
jgi:hypothetical protein